MQDDYDFDFKDVTLDDPDAPTSVIPLARTAFEVAGFEVREAEKAASHPVYIFKLKRRTAPRYESHQALQDGVGELLAAMGLPVVKNAALAHQYGDRIMVSYLWQPRRRRAEPRRARHLA